MQAILKIFLTQTPLSGIAIAVSGQEKVGIKKSIKNLNHA